MGKACGRVRGRRARRDEMGKKLLEVLLGINLLASPFLLLFLILCIIGALPWLAFFLLIGGVNIMLPLGMCCAFAVIKD